MATASGVEHRSFCRLCTALCGVVVTTVGDEVVRVTGDREHPLSAGYSCPKGRSLGALHHGADRLDRPAQRVGGELVPSTWSEVLDDIGARLADIVASDGPDSVGAFFGSGAAFDGSSKVARKLLHGLGSTSVYSAATVDAPCRPYVAELVTGNPGLYGRAVDFDAATLVLLVGLNPLVSHGHNSAFPNPRARLRAVLDRGELWVADPRRTETAAMATRHLAPRPGTDHVWLAAVIREVLRRGGVHEDRWVARRVDVLAEAVEPYSMDLAAERCDVPLGALHDLVEAIERHRAVSIVAGTGVSMTPSANVTEWLTWALALVTDSLDRPGGTIFNPGFLRSMDGDEWGASSAPAQGYPTSRPDLPRRLNEQPSAAIVDEIEGGNLRALLVLGGNPVTALPQTERVMTALAALDVLIVADVVRTETTALATHVLACAGQLERADLPVTLDATYPAVASQYTAAVVPLGADRRPLWWIAAAIGERLGLQVLPIGRSVDDCSDEIVLAYAARGARVPFEVLRDAPGCVIVGPTETGWVRRVVASHGGFDAAPAALVTQLAGLDDDAKSGALRLVPRRQLRHVNSQLAGDDTADGQRDDAVVLVNVSDAAARGIVDGDAVQVVSKHGAVLATARLDAAVRSGVVSLPHGFGGTNVNLLTTGVVADPLTGMVQFAALEVEVLRMRSRTDGACQPR